MTALPAAPGCRAEPLGPLTAPAMRTILVCGGRTYRSHRRMDAVLGAWAYPGATRFIQGGADGADYLCRLWCDAWDFPCETFAADWTLGKKAGPIRNQRMLDEGKPTLVIAFPGGRGTADMVKRAKAAGVPVVEVPG